MHNNPSIVAWFNRIFAPKGENFSPMVSDFIQPVIQIRPIANIVRHQTATTTGTTTIFTTPTDRDFFMTGLFLSVQADATADMGSVDISANVDNVNRNLARISHISLTATAREMVRSFATPIKIDRGVSITCTKSFSVGSASFSMGIEGFTQETISTFNS